MFRNIIFSGGAFKGWAFVGTIRALYELVDKKEIDSVVGVSIGSIFALLYVLEIKPEVIIDKLFNSNLIEFIDIDIDNVLKNQSILKGNKLKYFIQELMSTKVSEDITFEDLRKYTRIMLNVHSLNISIEEYTQFNYKNTPDVKVIDAVMASSALPLVLPPYKINEYYYYDGGLINNCPVNLYEEELTIGFDLFRNKQKQNFNSDIKIIDLMQILLNFVQKHNFKDSYNKHCVLDDKYDTQTFNFFQTKEEIYNMYMNGYKNSHRIIFDNYIAIKL